MRKAMTVGLRLTLALVIVLTSILLTDFSGATPIAAAAGECGWSAEPGWVEIAVQVDFNFSGSGDWVDFRLYAEGEQPQDIRVTRFPGEDYGVNAWGFDVEPDQDITIDVVKQGSSSTVASVTETSVCPADEVWESEKIANGDAWSLYVYDAYN